MEGTERNMYLSLLGRSRNPVDIHRKYLRTHREIANGGANILRRNTFRNTATCTSGVPKYISSPWPKCGFGRRTRPRNTRNTPERFTTKYRSTPERFTKKYRTIPERFAKKYIAMRVEVLKDTFQGEGRGSGSAPRLSAARRGSTAQARRGSTAQRGARRARRGEGVSRPQRQAR